MDEEHEKDIDSGSIIDEFILPLGQVSSACRQETHSIDRRVITGFGMACGWWCLSESLCDGTSLRIRLECAAMKELNATCNDERNGLLKIFNT